jgi:hypothetical protein
MRFIRLLVEWDYGQDNVLFYTEDDAKIWLEKAMREVDGSIEFDETYLNGISDVFDECLAGFEVVDTWQP